MSDRRARVTAAYATVKVLDTATGKPAIHGFYEGGIFPPSSDPDSVAALVRRGYAEWLDEPPPVEVIPAPVDDRPKPAEPKAAWVDYAVSKRAEGVSPDDARVAAEAKSKADLVAEHGGS